MASKVMILVVQLFNPRISGVSQLQTPKSILKQVPRLLSSLQLWTQADSAVELGEAQILLQQQIRFQHKKFYCDTQKIVMAVIQILLTCTLEIMKIN